MSDEKHLIGGSEEAEELVLELIVELDKMKSENKKLREALKYYANEGHIREYSYGQMVMLEAEECEEGVDEKSLPNLAGRTLEAFK